MQEPAQKTHPRCFSNRAKPSGARSMNCPGDLRRGIGIRVLLCVRRFKKRDPSPVRAKNRRAAGRGRDGFVFTV